MLPILKSVKIQFMKYLSLCPTNILPIVSFYVSFKPHLYATRCHQTAVHRVLKFKPPTTARRWHVINMDYGTFIFKLKPPPLENPGSASGSVRVKG